MHECTGKDTLSSTVTQVDEGAARDIVGIMPAVRILIFVSLLDPLEDLEERLEFNLSIGQVNLLQATLASLTSTFNLHIIQQIVRIRVNKVINDINYKKITYLANFTMKVACHFIKGL